MLMREFTSVKDVFNGESFLIYVLLSLFASITCFLLSYKFLQSLQQKNYILSDYFKWAHKKNNVFKSRVIMLVLLSSFAFMLFNCVFAFVENDYFSLLGLVFYLLFLFFYVKGEQKMENKVPLKFTARVKRLIVTFSITSFIIFFGLILLENYIFYYFNDFFKTNRFLVVTLLPLLMPLLIFISGAINMPLEKKLHKKFVMKATGKLEQSKCIKIGITGSFGKTSVKNFLADILSVKYKVVATPLSYNTPMGISKSVEQITQDTQVFIAEMGARRVGDIKELCDIVKPTISVVNGIIGAHLLTFGNINNVIKTKNELPTYDSVEYAVFSSDNENTIKLFNESKKEKILAGASETGEVFASNIKVDKNGSHFKINVHGESIYCETVLLGKHNISNICLAVAVANKLGLTLEEIKLGISQIKPVDHRLNLVRNDNITVIDDAYNSNVEGTKFALEVLGYFDGRKIIVTPGMTELGLEETKENYDFGVRLAKVVDYAILVDGASANAIRNGMVFGGGFNPDNVKLVSNLVVAKEKLKDIILDGDVILFENDLTDKF